MVPWYLLIGLSEDWTNNSPKQVSAFRTQRLTLCLTVAQVIFNCFFSFHWSLLSYSNLDVTSRFRDQLNHDLVHTRALWNVTRILTFLITHGLTLFIKLWATRWGYSWSAITTAVSPSDCTYTWHIYSVMMDRALSHCLLFIYRWAVENIIIICCDDTHTVCWYRVKISGYNQHFYTDCLGLYKCLQHHMSHKPNIKTVRYLNASLNQ